MNNREKNIIFIGFMGVGKTTIGQLVAKKLDRSFIDIDEVIENEYGMPCSQIFSNIGEQAFRKKEKEVITNYCAQKSQIISVGGGAFLQEDIRDICLSTSTVVYLDLSWDYWKERISLIIDSRPVLQGKTNEEIEQLFYERKKIYSMHHYKVQTDRQQAEEVADHIVDILKLDH